MSQKNIISSKLASSNYCSEFDILCILNSLCIRTKNILNSLVPISEKDNLLETVVNYNFKNDE